MIEAEGLGHFYDLRQGISLPVGERGLEPRDFGWLRTLAAQAEADARAGRTPVATLALPISGIHCGGCRWLIERLFARQLAAAACTLDAEGRLLCFSWQVKEATQDAEATQSTEATQSGPGPGFDVGAFADLLLAFGYALENPALPHGKGPHGRDPAAAQADTRKRLIPRLLLCGVFALNAVIFSLPLRLGASLEDFPFLRLFGLLVLLCATLATGLAASYFWRATPQALARPKRRNPHRRVPRRWVAFLLILLWLLAVAGPGLGLPAFFAADTAAVTSFVALLIAFATRG